MASRGIGNMGDVRRPPPFRHFLQLYRGETAFQAMVDFVVLGGLTIAFVEPQLFKHPFGGSSKPPAQQQQSAPAPASSPPPPPQASPARPSAPPTPPQAKVEPPAAAPAPAQPAAPVSDGAKAVAALKALPALPQNAIAPVTTPGLQELPIPFANSVVTAPHPASRFFTVDERAIARLPADLQSKVRAALDARADQDSERMRSALKDVDTPDGTADLLIGLSYVVNATPETIPLAEAAYRKALEKGQPQAPVLLGLLLTTGAKGLTGTPAEGKALIDAVSGNDRVAWYVIGAGYLNGESGTLDPARGLPWIRKSAEAGEPIALMQLARLAEGGIGMTKDMGLAEGALRRAADLGLTEAEDTLGRWIIGAYEKKKIDDPSEGVALEERVAGKNVLFAWNVLGRMYNSFGASPRWRDEAKGAKLYRDCAQYKIRPCQNNYAVVLQSGRGIERDPVAAWARYDVGRQLASDYVMPGFAQLDKILTPNEKEEAKKQSKEIMSGLKPQPLVIALRRDK